MPVRLSEHPPLPIKCFWILGYGVWGGRGNGENGELIGGGSYRPEIPEKEEQEASWSLELFILLPVILPPVLVLFSFLLCHHPMPLSWGWFRLGSRQPSGSGVSGTQLDWRISPVFHSVPSCGKNLEHQSGGRGRDDMTQGSIFEWTGMG